MKPMTLSAFGDRLVDLLPRLMQRTWRYERTFYSRSEITLPQLWALTHLYRHGSCSMCELAREMGARESTTSGLVDRMVRLGLLRRSRDRADRRRVTVVLTAAGRRSFRQLQSLRRRALMEMFRSTGAAERSGWLVGLENMSAKMLTVAPKSESSRRDAAKRLDSPRGKGSRS